MKQQLEEVRQQGYAVARSEAFVYYVAIGVPLQMAIHSRPMGCLVISSTRQLLSPEDEPRVIASAKTAVALLMNSAPSLHVLKHWTPRTERRQQ
ncbi:DNA-binding IclR family transcriptional regulator [Variovorax paradoxus]|uniref:DNA-binding IclR family transcriptional regulator n=1 Tax=Variovorax paradoxus TaxID=34073 RepID=A0AAW8E6Y8_VARPD|nr:IclR family transcriptional regulator C-terminal domain-containing protein [Variovorax paradoxus]MDP9968986.1 DNA-binding IclR family transcriptional regulator [Variovorax paradoxus]